MPAMNLWKRLRNWMQVNMVVVRFVVFFSVFLIIFFVLFSLFASSFDFLRVWTAHITSFISHLSGMEASVDGSALSMETMDFEVIHECTGVFAMMVYVSAIVAYPAGWRQRGLGLLVGIPVIFGVNIARMVVLVYVAISHEAWFDYVHSYLWQGTFIIFVILVWLLWIRRVVNR